MAVVHVILAKATATERNARYRAGDRHACMLYVCAEKVDLALLERTLREGDWDDIQFLKQGQVDGDHVATKLAPDDPHAEAYRNARRNGISVVVFNDAE